MAMEDIETLERGNVYFIYRPRVVPADAEEKGQAEVEGIDDVERLYMVLSPHGQKAFRLVILGQKQMPNIGDGGQRNWGFVDFVTSDPKEMRESFAPEEYDTKTRGRRKRPAGRPAGEGVYQIVKHGDHTHFAYVLELPKDIGEAQKGLHIGEEGSYIISVKNPDKPSPPRAGLRSDQEADYPKKLKERFKDKRFISIETPEFLDYEGTELLFVGAKQDVSEELGIELNAQDEDEQTAEIFNDLRLRKSKHKIEPLIKGIWA